MKNLSINIRSGLIMALGLLIAGAITTAGAYEQNVDSLDANSHFRTPVTHGF